MEVCRAACSNTYIRRSSGRMTPEEARLVSIRVIDVAKP